MNSTKGYKGMAMEGLIAVWYARITRSEQRHRQAWPSSWRAGSPRAAGFWRSPPDLAISRSNWQNSAAIRSRVWISAGHSWRWPGRMPGRRASRWISAWATPQICRSRQDSFDFTFCQAAFKNFSEPVRAIAEMHRVLRPHGTAVIVDLRRDASRSEIDRHIQSLGLGGINRFMTRWTFQQMLLKSAYTISQMEAFVSQTDFRACRIEPDDIGFTAWLEK